MLGENKFFANHSWFFVPISKPWKDLPMQYIKIVNNRNMDNWKIITTMYQSKLPKFYSPPLFWLLHGKNYYISSTGKMETNSVINDKMRKTILLDNNINNNISGINIHNRAFYKFQTAKNVEAQF